MSNNNYYPTSEYSQQRPEGSYYGAPTQSYGGYSSYEPPRDERPRHDMAVTQFDDERSRYSERRRSGSRSERSRDRTYYDDRRTEYDDDRDYERERNSSRRRSSSRPRSRGDGEGRSKNHHLAKEVGATAVGGAIGAFAGHELGKKNGLVTTIGTLAGAWAGHELEKRHERKKSEKREVRSEDYSRRSSSRQRQYENEDDEYDDRRQYGRDSSRY